MDILIKGMKMPKNCDECRIMVFEDTNCEPELYCGCPIVFQAHPQGVGNRPNYCPLIPIPKHGDLIDRDELVALVYANIALFDSIPGRLSVGQKLVREWLRSMADDINEAPTVIPAEEGE